MHFRCPKKSLVVYRATQNPRKANTFELASLVCQRDYSPGHLCWKIHARLSFGSFDKARYEIECRNEDNIEEILSSALESVSRTRRLCDVLLYLHRRSMVRKKALNTSARQA